MLGPGSYDLMKGMPPGAQQIQCSLAPSGHFMRHCAEFPTCQENPSAGGLELVQQLAFPVTQASTAVETPVDARPRS